ncbi:MAG: pseudouridylate synthase [Prevotella sp.]
MIDIMQFTDIDIHELLPQQPPFVMIDRLEYFDDKSTICRLVVDADNMFCDDGKLSASGLIENIAQTCAARLGYVNKYVLKKDVQVGYIGAIRNLEINRLPSVGETLLTTIVVEESVLGMTLASAEIKSGDEIIATTTIKIALRDESV